MIVGKGSRKGHTPAEAPDTLNIVSKTAGEHAGNAAASENSAREGALTARRYWH